MTDFQTLRLVLAGFGAFFLGYVLFSVLFAVLMWLSSKTRTRP